MHVVSPSNSHGGLTLDRVNQALQQRAHRGWLTALGCAVTLLLAACDGGAMLVVPPEGSHDAPGTEPPGAESPGSDPGVALPPAEASGAMPTPEAAGPNEPAPPAPADPAGPRPDGEASPGDPASDPTQPGNAPAGAPDEPGDEPDEPPPDEDPDPGEPDDPADPEPLPTEPDEPEPVDQQPPPSEEGPGDPDGLPPGGSNGEDTPASDPPGDDSPGDQPPDDDVPDDGAPDAEPPGESPPGNDPAQPPFEPPGENGGVVGPQSPEIPGGLPSFHISIIGSSTAGGVGASAPALAWANQLEESLRQRVATSVTTENLAVGGYTAYDLAPGSGMSGSIDVAIREAPDLILIALAGSNDLDGTITTEFFVSQLIGLRESAKAAGIPTFFMGTLPKNFDEPNRQLLVDFDRAMASEFGACWIPGTSKRYAPCYIDVFDSLADTSLGLAPAYDSGDGQHPNDAGHAVLFRAAQAIVEPYVCSKTSCR